MTWPTSNKIISCMTLIISDGDNPGLIEDIISLEFMAKVENMKEGSYEQGNEEKDG